MDPATIFGTITAAIGAVDMIANRLEQIHNRYKSYSENPSKWLELAHEYMEAKGCLKSIQRTLRGRKLSEDAKPEFENTFNAISAMMGSVRQQLEQIEARFQERKRDRLRKFTHAFRDKDVLDFAEKRLERVMARIERLAISLKQEEMGEDIRLQLQGMGEDIRLRLEDMRIRREHADVEEFKAVGGRDAVEATPEFLALDYNSKDHEGEAVTVEGKLKAKILQTQTIRSVGVLDAYATDSNVTGAVGGGGVGKTCAVRGLAKDPEIQASFTGGIYEIVLGKDANRGTITDRLRILIQLTGGGRTAGQLDGISDLNAHIVKACEWFRSQREPCLFIVDDVWENNDIDGTIICELSKITDACNGCIVFTSRNQSLSEVAGEIVEFRARDTYSKEARAMLLCKARMNESDTLVLENEEKITKVLENCGGLPAALAVAGRLAHDLKRNDPWGRLLNRLERSTSSLWTKCPKGYRALSKLLDAALEYLDEKRDSEDCLQTTYSFHEMGRSLCVLEKQEFAPIRMLGRLWNLEIEESLEVVELMANVGIVTQEYGRIEGKSIQYEEEGLRIHDLVNEYFTFKATTARGKFGFHKRLLDNYLSGSENWSICGTYRTWWILKDDVYIFERLCRHLIAGELRGEAVDLLLDPRWTAVSLVEYGIRQLKQDHNMTIQALQRSTTESEERRVTEDKIRALRLVLGAAQLSSNAVSQNEKEVWYQLYGRLISFKEGSRILNEYLEGIEKHAKRPWLKPSPGILRAPGSGIIETFSLPLSFATRDIAIDNDNTVLVVLSDSVGPGMTLWKRHPDASEHSTQLSSPFEPPSATTVVSFSKDGKKFAGHANGSVVLWNSCTGKKICDLLTDPHNTMPVAQLVWSMDGERLAALKKDFTYVWETQRGERVGCFPGENIQCVALSPKGRRLVRAIEKEYAQVVDVESGVVLQRMKEYCWKTNSIHWLSDTTILVCASVPTFMIWNSDTGQCMAEPSVDDDISYLSSSMNEHQVAGLVDGRTTLILFKVPSFDIMGKARLSNTYERGRVALSPNGSRMVWTPEVTEEQGVILPSDLPSYVLDTQLVDVAENSVRPYSGQVELVRFSNDGKWLACGRENGSLQVWDMLTRSPELEWNGIGDDVCVLEWSRDGSKLAAGHLNGQLCVWSWRSKQQIGGLLDIGRVTLPYSHIVQFGGDDDDHIIYEHDGAGFAGEWDYIGSGRFPRTGDDYQWRLFDRTERDQNEILYGKRLAAIHRDGAVRWEGERLGSIEVTDGRMRHSFDFSENGCDVTIVIGVGTELYFIDLIEEEQ